MSAGLWFDDEERQDTTMHQVYRVFESCGLMMKKDKIQHGRGLREPPTSCGLMMKKDKIQPVDATSAQVSVVV